MQPEQRSLYGFWAKCMALVLPVGALVVGVNAVVDPGEVFFRRNFKLQVAQALVDGNNVRCKNIPASWAELQAAIVRDFFKAQRRPPEVCVWGTSRSSELSKSVLRQSVGFFNHAVPGGSVLDYVALYGAYSEQGRFPRTVILNIDPWTFCARKAVVIDGRTYYLPSPDGPLKLQAGTEAAYQRGMAELGEAVLATDFQDWSQRIRELGDLVSLSYFQNAVSSWRDRGLTITKESYSDRSFVIRADGSYSLRNTNGIDPARVANFARQFAMTGRETLLSETTLVERNVRIFEKLLKRLKADQVKVCLFVAPLHPAVYDSLVGSGQAPLEKYLDKIAREGGIQLVGSLNPHRYRLTSEEPYFIDQYHPSVIGIQRILDEHSGTLAAVQSQND